MEPWMPEIAGAALPATRLHAGAANPPLAAEQVDRLQREALSQRPSPAGRAAPGLAGLVVDNHRWNHLLWREEDQARRTDVPDSAIVRNKRAIDRYNQCRNDAVEAIDDWLLGCDARRAPRPDAWLNSETAGSIVDRLSINLLKIHHMGLQARRQQAGAEHMRRCADRLARLQAQRADLLHALQRLLDGLVDGRCCFRVYRQFKMYNDPSLNPCLHGGRGHE